MDKYFLRSKSRSTEFFFPILWIELCDAFDLPDFFMVPIHFEGKKEIIIKASITNLLQIFWKEMKITF